MDFLGSMGRNLYFLEPYTLNSIMPAFLNSIIVTSV